MMNMPPVTKNLIIINLLFFLAKLVAVRYGVIWIICWDYTSF